MLTSLALIFLVGLFMAAVFQWMRLPRIIGMLMTGILLGGGVSDSGYNSFRSDWDGCKLLQITGAVGNEKGIRLMQRREGFAILISTDSWAG